MESSVPAAARQLFEAHPRRFEANRYVYPVLSRRAGGISIGVNLNLDQRCNFDCIYCQVNRSQPAPKESVDVARLVAELEQMVETVVSGRIYQEARFGRTPPELRRLNDFALSGDGEPTMVPNFVEVVGACAEVRRRLRLDDVKIVLITNASLLHRENVSQGLEILDANNGEIWAKLDAGTEAYYQAVARSAVPFSRILENLRDAAKVRPVVIQSLFMRIRGQGPSCAEQEAYCERLREIVVARGRIKLVQVHTIARPPAEAWVSPLSDAEVDTIAERVRRRTSVPVAVFYAG